MRCFLACILHTAVLPDLTELEPLAMKARERQRKHHHPTHHNPHRRCHHPTASPNAVAGATVIASASATANAAEFDNRNSTLNLKGKCSHMFSHTSLLGCFAGIILIMIIIIIIIAMRPGL